AAELREQVTAAGLPWMEDPGNRTPEPERNFLRHEILPRLTQRRPGALRAMGRSARLVAAAAEAEAERAETDCGALETAEGGLSIAGLRRLTPERAGAALHCAATARGLPVPDENRTRRILTEVAAARPDAAPQVAWPGARARRHRGAIFLLPPLPDPPPEQPWQPGEPLDWPAGRLTAERNTGEGVAASALAGTVTVGPPVPGERLPGPGGHQRISELLRAAGIAPWWRPHWPVIRVDGGPVALVGIRVCPAVRPGPEEPGWLLYFEPAG
ncbi:MAG: TilS substrate-binding domain-containing protein, partial [Thiohalospira sp.]